MQRIGTIAAIALCLTCTALLAEDRRPNILFMFTDDQPRNCMGVMGNQYIQTPNLDRLARRGTLFNNAFVTTAICCCNRSCILTGQHMIRHGIRDFIEPLSAAAFDRTYPALLRKAGYRTGFLGKWLMYENSIRVPLIIHDPRIDAKRVGGRRDEMVLSIDLAPTMLSLAGLAIPDTMQGKNMMPLIDRQSTDWRTHYYYEHTYQTEPPRSPIPKTEGIRTQRWKYIRYPEVVPVFEQLFDLVSDPLERTNLALAPEHQGRLTELRTMCNEAPNSLR